MEVTPTTTRTPRLPAKKARSTPSKKIRKVATVKGGKKPSQPKVLVPKDKEATADKRRPRRVMALPEDKPEAPPAITTKNRKRTTNLPTGVAARSSQIMIRVPAHIKDAISARAAHENITMSAYVYDIIIRWLE